MYTFSYTDMMNNSMAPRQGPIRVRLHVHRKLEKRKDKNCLNELMTFFSDINI